MRRRRLKRSRPVAREGGRRSLFGRSCLQTMQNIGLPHGSVLSPLHRLTTEVPRTCADSRRGSRKSDVPSVRGLQRRRTSSRGCLTIEGAGSFELVLRWVSIMHLSSSLVKIYLRSKSTTR